MPTTPETTRSAPVAIKSFGPNLDCTGGGWKRASKAGSDAEPDGKVSTPGNVFIQTRLARIVDVMSGTPPDQWEPGLDRPAVTHPVTITALINRLDRFLGPPLTVRHSAPTGFIGDDERIREKAIETHCTQVRDTRASMSARYGLAQNQGAWS